MLQIQMDVLSGVVSVDEPADVVVSNVTSSTCPYTNDGVFLILFQVE